MRASSTRLSGPLIGLSLLLSGCQEPRPPIVRPLPKFTGTSIPDPPAQGVPWTPPKTKLPQSLVTATRVLFESGVADPRGCEYREVETGDTQLVRTHGFVLPAAPGVSGRFVVDWDGVVRPAFSVGPRADLAVDIRALAAEMKADRLAMKASRDSGPSHGSVFWNPAYSFHGRDDRGDVADRSPLKLVMLLRLDRADLAEALFAAGTPWTPRDDSQRDPADPRMTLVSLAGGWRSILWHRAGYAHARSDDAVALDAARRLSAFEQRFSAATAALGIPANDPRTPRNQLEQPLALLLADQERRAREGLRPAVPRGADPAARVAALIRDFDQIAERQTTWPGSANPGDAAIVKEVVAEGEAAVEPLLALLESDTRLTRTITWGDEPASGFTIHPVYEAVVVALRDLLKTETSVEHAGVFSLDVRKARARELRDFWARNRGVPLPERWYRTLADDRAGEEKWAKVSLAIVTPSQPQRGGPSADGKPASPNAAGRPSLAGESLRARRDPAVSELLARRALQTTRGQELTVASFGPEFGSVLYRWDPEAALPVLRTLTRRMLDWSPGAVPNAHEPRYRLRFGPTLDRFTNILAQAGDTAPRDEYVAWLQRNQAEAPRQP